jgi:hypothetical protein
VISCAEGDRRAGHRPLLEFYKETGIERRFGRQAFCWVRWGFAIPRILEVLIGRLEEWTRSTQAIAWRVRRSGGDSGHARRIELKVDE